MSHLQTGEVKPSYLEGLFACHIFDQCGGQWLYLEDYLKWLKNADLSTLSDDAQSEVRADKIHGH